MREAYSSKNVFSGALPSLARVAVLCELLFYNLHCEFDTFSLKAIAAHGLVTRASLG
jgi:hypothetical protein